MDANQPGGQPPMDPNDKLIAALSYPIMVIVPLIILLTDMKNKPFLKYHAWQSLVVGVVLGIVIAVTGPFTCGLTGLLWLVTLYWAYQAYQGQYFTIPVVTDFVKNQHWV